MTFQDLTHIKKFERDALIQQRLAAVGEMAAGIAHEIRNPLASMSGSIQILRQELSLSTEQEQLMDIVMRESERLNATIGSFLAYTRPQRFAIARLDIRRALTDTALLLRNSAEVHERHKIELDLPASPVPYEADDIRSSKWCGTSPPTASGRCPTAAGFVCRPFGPGDGHRDQRRGRRNRHRAGRARSSLSAISWHVRQGQRPGIGDRASHRD